MLAKGTHWSLVFGVMSVYEISQGLVRAFCHVATDYYMKDHRCSKDAAVNTQFRDSWVSVRRKTPMMRKS